MSEEQEEVWEVGFYAGHESKWVAIREGSRDFCLGFLEGIEFGADNLPAPTYYKIKRKS